MGPPVPMGEERLAADLRVRVVIDLCDKPKWRKRMRAVFGLAAVILVFVTGCATTEQMAVKEQPAVCGFLGDSCRDLEKGGEGQVGLRWVNPKAQLTQYNKVIVDVVGFFGADAAKVPPKDEEALTALFHKSLTEALAKKYQVVDQSGPGV